MAHARFRPIWGLAILALLIWVAPHPASTQTSAAPEGILVLNQDRLFSASLYGQRVQSELEAAGESLAAENREIEAQLTEEEMRLTGERATMDPMAFRALAEEFDARVGEIRQAQETKAQSLSLQADAARQRFFELAFPILLDLVRERGAAVIMDNRAVLLSAESVDITALALERVDARLGDGGEGPLLQGGDLPAPLARPDDENGSSTAP
ncbi:OmpH family outer membrane protein [Roseobacter sp. HKCCD9010]|uniref:OmpH family outer membrane protein n=1 Tax=unclassified Roseobacter TaxID=196798 RepID=UPI001492BD89|nr:MULTISPECIES: OmpH family outer membrane protein [unclassified Roseobacter]MBF9050547.1 OmpH family outer membrane protein [Rhodobacterales bacterium HKCCD4356]NNW92446.1 OmpH family outer membrane protein [Roseobacter sp. HKCCD9063]NNX86035.1 OmpH family outer membrane protein [Roseobacter sp. HKCCD8809]NNY46119.1 OmpH family outer membrane protein [Roseobacter sp. HKCCD8801]NNZ94034.1 OmpH family outer membrane protein [Roseobacter sp. HKCCD5934-2]NOA49468.1 OmpH family outer membrane pr